MTGRPQDDEEVRRALLGAPRLFTYTELHDMLCERFGAARAWSRSAIARFFHARCVRRGNASKLDKDAEVLAFVEDRLGRWSIDAIAAEARRRFGPKRAPSRSSIHRLHARLRLESRAAPPAERPATAD